LPLLTATDLPLPRDQKVKDEVKAAVDVRKCADQRNGCQLQDLFSEKHMK